MSPRLLAQLKAFRTSMAVTPLDSESPNSWVYGLNPMERNPLNGFVVMQRWEREDY